MKTITERRYDAVVGRAKVDWTPEGYARVSGAFARVGVLNYSFPDGTRRRELVTREVLADAASIATLTAKPVSFLHPPGGTIRAANWRQYAEGEVLGAPKMNPDGVHLDGEVMLRSDRIIGAARSGIRQLSAGYEADIEMRSGVFEDPITGERSPFDAVQVARRYNHVAVVPTGRAGDTVALRMDAVDEYAVQVCDSADDDESRPAGEGEPLDDAEDSTAEEAPGPDTPDHVMKTRKLRIDGIDIELPEEQCDAIEAALKTRNDAADAAAKEDHAKLTRERDELKGEVAALKATASTQRLDEAEVQKRVDSRIELLDIAVANGVKREDAAKLSDIDVRKRVICARFPELKLDGMTDGELAGAYRAAVADPRRDHSTAFARNAAEAATRNDGVTQAPSVDDIYKGSSTTEA